jgi:GH25 family lysozyme M1 (1,4-beta-N-acetylmuramidase)
MKRDYLSKRFSIPLWALLAILAVCIVTLTIPDEGSYYHKRELEEATPPPAFLEVEAPGEVESRLIGIDVSQYQGEIDWEKVAASGVRFVIIRATMGLGGTDPNFISNWEGAKKAGLLVSAYHIFFHDESPVKQALAFVQALDGREPDFPLALDVEIPARGNYGAQLEDMCLTMEILTGQRPMIYTAQYIWNTNVGWGPKWHLYPLWVADYDAAAPAMPDGWERWSIWQYSNKGRISGIEGHVDLNLFEGTEEELKRLGE